MRAQDDKGLGRDRQAAAVAVAAEVVRVAARVTGVGGVMLGGVVCCAGRILAHVDHGSSDHDAEGKHPEDAGVFEDGAQAG